MRGFHRLFLFIALLSCGCSHSPDVVVGQGEAIFPSETLTDWVSYGLQVSEVTVLTEERAGGDPTDADPYVARLVQINVDKNLWVNSDGFSPVAGTIEFFASGWVKQGDHEALFALLNSPRLEVGGHYIMPLTLMPPEVPSMWGPLGTSAVLGVPGDQVAEEDVQQRGNLGAATAFSGRPESELASALANTPMDPRVVPFRTLSPYERLQAANQAP